MSFLGLGRIARDVSGSVVDVAEVFRPNAERSAQRDAQRFTGAQGQFGAEFTATERRGWFNSLVDGFNRLPRPVLVSGTIGLFVFAMVDPVGFAERMVGLAAVPDQLWWILGAIVTFYFGAREMAHSRENGFASAQGVRQIVSDIEAIRMLRPDSVSVAADDTELRAGEGDNAAIDEWLNQS